MTSTTSPASVEVEEAHGIVPKSTTATIPVSNQQREDNATKLASRLSLPSGSPRSEVSSASPKPASPLTNHEQSPLRAATPTTISPALTPSRASTSCLRRQSLRRKAGLSTGMTDDVDDDDSSDDDEGIGDLSTVNQAPRHVQSTTNTTTSSGAFEEKQLVKALLTNDDIRGTFNHDKVCNVMWCGVLCRGEC